MSDPYCIIELTRKGKQMTKDVKNMLLIYVLPIIVLSLVMVFIAPAIYAQVILGMVMGTALLCVGMAFLIDYLEKRG